MRKEGKPREQGPKQAPGVPEGTYEKKKAQKEGLLQSPKKKGNKDKNVAQRPLEGEHARGKMGAASQGKDLPWNQGKKVGRARGRTDLKTSEERNGEKWQNSCGGGREQSIC